MSIRNLKILGKCVIRQLFVKLSSSGKGVVLRPPVAPNPSTGMLFLLFSSKKSQGATSGRIMFASMVNKKVVNTVLHTLKKSTN